VSELIVVKSAFDAIEALRSVVAGREDFVYTPPESEFGTCVNFTQESGEDEIYRYCPSCVVGHVLALWGLPESLWAHFSRGTVDTVTESLKFIGEDSPFQISEQAVWVLDAAQSAQDHKVPWGEALARAERTYATLSK
jgi:hypothetical protein